MGPLLNYSLVVEIYKNVPCVKGQPFFFCPSSLAKSCQNIATFYNHAKIKRGPQLNCCRVNSTLADIPVLQEDRSCREEYFTGCVAKLPPWGD